MEPLWKVEFDKNVKVKHEQSNELVSLEPRHLNLLVYMLCRQLLEPRNRWGIPTSDIKRDLEFADNNGTFNACINKLSKALLPTDGTSIHAINSKRRSTKSLNLALFNTKLKIFLEVFDDNGRLIRNVRDADLKEALDLLNLFTSPGSSLRLVLDRGQDKAETWGWNYESVAYALGRRVRDEQEWRKISETHIERKRELADLKQHAQNGTGVLSLFAPFGRGKTTLLASWRRHLDNQNLRYFYWDFGSATEGNTDRFFQQAIGSFSRPNPSSILPSSPLDRGEILVHCLQNEETILLLDNFEELQKPDGSSISHEGIHLLLQRLSEKNKGMCVVASSVALPHSLALVPVMKLPGLTPKEGADLLRRLGVRGGDNALCEFSENRKGHPLELKMAAQQLIETHDGDVSCYTELWKQPGSDSEEFFKVMGEYEAHLKSSGNIGLCTLEILKLISLFDRPVPHSLLEHLKKAEELSPLNKHTKNCSSSEWSAAVNKLKDSPFVDPSSVGAKSLIGFDLTASKEILWRYRENRTLNYNARTVSVSSPEDESYSLPAKVRDYLAEGLQKSGDYGWRKAHWFLYLELTSTKRVPYWPDDEEGVNLLFQAVFHACKAGYHSQAFNVYWKRILRSEIQYAWRHFREYDKHRQVLNHFFDKPSNNITMGISPKQESAIHNLMGFFDMIAGAPEKAISPLWKAFRLSSQEGDWAAAGIRAENLWEANSALGRLEGARKWACRALRKGRKSGVPYQVPRYHAAMGYALFQLGKTPEASIEFEEAECGVGDTQLPQLPGYWYCDFLLSQCEEAMWRRLLKLPDEDTSQMLTILAEILERSECISSDAEKHPVSKLLYGSLARLLRGRAELVLVVITKDDSQEKRNAVSDSLDAAVRGLELYGHPYFTSWGYHARAALRYFCEDLHGAEKDLVEIMQISKAYPLRQLDAELTLARIKGDRKALERVADEAKRYKYHRRDTEIADALRAFGKFVA